MSTEERPRWIFQTWKHTLDWPSNINKGEKIVLISTVPLIAILIQVGQSTNEVNVTCYVYHKGDIQMTLIQTSDYDDGVEVPALEVNGVMGDIKVARFVLKNPQQFNGQSFFCEGSNGLSSQNEAVIEQVSGNDYFTSEWSEWSKCNDVKNMEMAFRTRKTGDGNSKMQSRYCRCSDLKEPPSPRFVSKQKSTSLK